VTRSWRVASVNSIAIICAQASLEQRTDSRYLAILVRVLSAQGPIKSRSNNPEDNSNDPPEYRVEKDMFPEKLSDGEIAFHLFPFSLIFRALPSKMSERIDDYFYWHGARVRLTYQGRKRNQKREERAWISNPKK
jgi:hypothetical protein